MVEATGWPEKTVRNFDRNLVLAGLRHTDGMGRPRSFTTPDDATNFVAAILGCDMAAEVSAVVPFVLKSPRSSYVELGARRAIVDPREYQGPNYTKEFLKDVPGLGLSKGAPSNLGDMIAALISASAHKDFATFGTVRISMTRNPARICEIVFRDQVSDQDPKGRGLVVIYGPPGAGIEYGEDPHKRQRGVANVRTLWVHDLAPVGRLYVEGEGN